MGVLKAEPWSVSSAASSSLQPWFSLSCVSAVWPETRAMGSCCCPRRIFRRSKWITVRETGLQPKGIFEKFCGVVRVDNYLFQMSLSLFISDSLWKYKLSWISSVCAYWIIHMQGIAEKTLSSKDLVNKHDTHRTSFCCWFLVQLLQDKLGYDLQESDAVQV